MGSETNDCYEQTPPKLSLLISRPSRPPEPPTPTRKTAVSVPFKWEEAPGKPRRCHTESDPKSNVARTLELPPRLLFSEANISNLPSPTTVLDGPYVGRAMSFTTSYRSSRGLGKEQWSGSFGSSRWSGFRKSKEEFGDSFDFRSSTPAVVNGNSKVKTTKISSRGSLFRPSQAKTHLWNKDPKSKTFIVHRIEHFGDFWDLLAYINLTFDFLLASIYDSLKQVVAWGRRPSDHKHRKSASKFYTV